MKKRILALLLAALLTGSLLSCGDSAAETEAAADTAAETAEETIDPNDRSLIPDSLPDDLDFGGRTYTSYVPNNSEQIKYYSGSEELAGEVVNEAVLSRNLAVEERLNISLNHVEQNDVDTTNYKQKVSALMMAGDTTYDTYMGYQWQLTQMLTTGGFVNLYDLEYLDFDQPWWWNNYMDELTLNEDVRIFAVGDYIIHALMNTRALFYNKDLYAKFYEDGEGLYNTVLEGNWTLDAMAELSESVYADTNGNGEMDVADQLGYVTYLTFSSVDAFVYATDIEFAGRTDDGHVQLNMEQEDAITLTEKLVDFFYQPGSMHQVESNINTFLEGNTLFLGNATLNGAYSLREMESDFGMIPYPKLDAEQENYRALVHDGTLILSVNGASQNLDILGAVLEAMCAETYRTLTPAWYETALKIKYTRDNLSAQMIDLIHDSITTNFIFAYNYAINDIGMVYRSLVTANSKDYVSTVKSKEKSAQASLDALYELFTTATE